MARHTLKDLSYAAGFLDGEGHFSQENRSIRLVCCHTHLPTLKFLKRLFGGSIYTDKTYLAKPYAKPHYKQRHHYYVGGFKAYEACVCLNVFLKEKKKQAESLIKYYEKRA